MTRLKAANVAAAHATSGATARAATQAMSRAAARATGCAVLCGLLAAAPAAVAAAERQKPDADDRGRLLYDTYCVQCHTQQVHWRDRRLASDWSRLKQEVVRWQAIVGQRWDDRDVTSVARYLNDRFYHHVEDAAATPTASAEPAR